MAERKVYQKYYAIDWDPSKIPRAKKDTTKQQFQTVRMMLPMSIQCTTCGEYMYKGKKFNSKKEVVQGESYLGIKTIRFYIRCTRCGSQVTFKTDPKNSTYVAEHGCTQNYDANREFHQELEAHMRQKLEAAEGNVDAMKQLEARQATSKQEVDMMDSLDELRTINALHQRVSTDDLAAIVEHKSKAQQKKRDDDEFTAEEKAKLKRLFGASAASVVTNGDVARLDDDLQEEIIDDDGNTFDIGSASGSATPSIASSGARTPSLQQHSRKRKRVDPMATPLILAQEAEEAEAEEQEDSSEQEDGRTQNSLSQQHRKMRRLEDIEKEADSVSSSKSAVGEGKATSTQETKLQTEPSDEEDVQFTAPAPRQPKKNDLFGGSASSLFGSISVRQKKSKQPAATAPVQPSKPQEESKTDDGSLFSLSGYDSS